MSQPPDGPTLRPIVFCVMAYGKRRHPDTEVEIDFDHLYEQVLVPAIRAAGAEAIRSDRESGGGMIHTSMFERLLLADVVLADVSMPNANVFYELGIRHATRPRATITLSCDAAGPLPFDVAPLRHIRYGLDQVSAAADNSLGRQVELRIKEALVDRTGLDSPLFQTIAAYPGVELAHEVAESYRDRVQVVVSLHQAIREAVLAEDMERLATLAESSRGVSELEIDIILAYRDLAAYAQLLDYLATTHFVTSATGVELGAFARNRRADPGDRGAALAALRDLESREGTTSERSALRGRIHKDQWLATRPPTGGQYHPELLSAIEAYRDGLNADPRDPLPGINLATLLYVAHRDAELAEITPVVAFALARRGGAQSRDYFDVAGVCELSVILGNEEDAYRAAGLSLSRPHTPWMLASTAANLNLLAELRPFAASVADLFTAAITSDQT